MLTNYPYPKTQILYFHYLFFRKYQGWQVFTKKRERSVSKLEREAYYTYQVWRYNFYTSLSSWTKEKEKKNSREERKSNEVPQVTNQSEEMSKRGNSTSSQRVDKVLKTFDIFGIS